MKQNIKILIVEDIEATALYIKSSLENRLDLVEKPKIATTLDDAYELIKNNSFDIVLFDIRFPEGNSFDLLQKLKSNNLINFEIIFITGEGDKEYVLNAIKYSAIDFLYKPLDIDELIEAIEKATKRLINSNYNQKVGVLLSMLNKGFEQNIEKVAFHVAQGGVEFVEVKKVIYLQADGVVTKVFIDDSNNPDKYITAHRNLGYYKNMLVNDFNFLILSNSLLLNPQYIKRFVPKELAITLSNGKVLFASRRYGKSLKEKFVSTKK
ncbi:MAG: LytR/AlgR family response regulator transcription factor [Bacteroidales bacterium]|jgi:two-component system LytT family response regulator